jgi:hypothetical protein
MGRVPESCAAMRAVVALAVFLLAGQAAAQATRVGAWGWGSGLDGAWDFGDGRGFTLFASSTTDFRVSAGRTARDEVRTWHPFHESVRFLVRDDGRERRFAFETALRGGADLRRGGFAGEVLLAALDLAPAPRHGFVRLGRQWVVQPGSAGLVRIDGALGRLTMGRLGLDAWAGVPIRDDVFRPKREDVPLSGWGRDWTWGVAAFLANHKATQARLSLVERHRDGALGRRSLGLDLHQGIRGRVNIRANLDVDLLVRQFREVRAGVDGRILPWLQASFDYEHWEPSFDQSELWSVFATDPFDAVRGQVQVTPLGWLSLHAGGGVEVYPQAVTKDDVPRPEVGRRSGMQWIGLRLSPVPWLGVDVSERLVAGTGGDKFGLDASLRVRPWRGRLELAARGTVQRYAFLLQPQLGGTYGSIGIEVTIRPTPWIRATLGGEWISSPFLTGDVQAHATVEFLLGVRHHRVGEPVASLGDPALLALQDRSRVAKRVGQMPGLGGGIGLGGEGR